MERPQSIHDAFENYEPSLVVNCAAWTDVDACEHDPEKAFRVNALGAHHVAQAARAQDARLVHTSTDYVFPGTKPPKTGPTTPETAYMEDDTTGPVNVYGASKLAGEHLTRQAHPRALVVRLSSVFGTRPGEYGSEQNNFIDTMLHLASTQEELQVVNDQYMTPTYAQDAAEAILTVAFDHPDLRGSLHITNPKSCTWYDLAQHAVRGAGHDSIPVRPVPASDFPRDAPRPRNSALNTGRLQKLEIILPSWEDAVNVYLHEEFDTNTTPRGT